MKTKSALKLNKDEIIYNVINSGLAGGLVFLGSLTNGFSFQGLGIGIAAGLIVMVTKFKDYWVTQEGEYITKLFSFY